MKAIEVNVGSHCSCNCIFCNVKSHWKVKNVTLEELKDSFEGKLDIGEDIKIDFCAIESTNNPYFKDIVEYFAPFKNIKRINLVTTGEKIDNIEYLEGLIDAGLTEITVSIHSIDNETETKITGNNKIFYTKIKAIKNIIKFKNVDLYVNFVIVKYNYNQINKFVVVLYTLGVRNFNIFYPKSKIEEVEIEAGNSWVKMNKIDFISLNKLKDYLVDAKINIMDVPYCIINSNNSYDKKESYRLEEGHKMEVFINNIDTVYLDGCKDCTQYNKCNGISVGYYHKYGGSEFIPIKE